MGRAGWKVAKNGKDRLCPGDLVFGQNEVDLGIAASLIINLARAYMSNFMFAGQVYPYTYVSVPFG